MLLKNEQYEDVLLFHQVKENTDKIILDGNLDSK